jgi:hypothetical protein
VSSHSLKAPGFNPCAYEVISWFQNLLFTNGLTCTTSFRQRRDQAQKATRAELQQQYRNELFKQFAELGD